MPSRVPASMSTVREHAALADEPQCRQSLEQSRADLGALADQHEGFGVAQPIGQHVVVLHVIGPNGHVVTGKLLEAREGAQGVPAVVEDRDLHRYLLARAYSPPPPHLYGTCLQTTSEVRGGRALGPGSHSTR